MLIWLYVTQFHTTSIKSYYNRRCFILRYTETHYYTGKQSFTNCRRRWNKSNSAYFSKKKSKALDFQKVHKTICSNEFVDISIVHTYTSVPSLNFCIVRTHQCSLILYIHAPERLCTCIYLEGGSLSNNPLQQKFQYLLSEITSSK